MPAQAMSRFCTVIALLSTLPTAVRSDEGVNAALESAVLGHLIPYRLEVQCADAGTPRAFSLYRGEVAIWNNERQINLPAEDSLAILKILREARFSEFEERYGGVPKAEQQKAPLRVYCRVHLSVAGQEKTSVQLYGGEPSARLLELADALLDRVGALATAGIVASNLEDGLAHLAAGTLAAEALRLRYVRLPEDEKSLGVIVQVEHGQLSHQRYAPGRRLDPQEVAPISDDCLKRIAAAATGAEAWSLPRNMRWQTSLDIEFQVLDQKAQILAREGFRAEASPRQTERLLQLLDALEALPTGCR